MAISLYDATVGSYLQVLAGAVGFLEKGRDHFPANELGEIVETRLWPDMFPFRSQVISIAHHSRGAIEGAKAGVFTPPSPRPELDYAGLQDLVADARAALENVTPAEIDALVGRDVVFNGQRTLPFVAENFLLSFSLPNFYFHTTTAYDILRSKGAPLGKRDFMGAIRIKAA